MFDFLRKQIVTLLAGPSTLNLPHAVKRVVEVAALPTVGEPEEAVTALDLDPPQPEDVHSQNVIPPSQPK